MNNFPLLVFVAAAMMGCSVVDRQPGNVLGVAHDRMDVTIGTYGQGREGQLILVTMEAAIHQDMVKDRPISSKNNSPSALPIRYMEFLRSMKERYGINRVADWPLSAVGIYCLVFESDGRRSTGSLINLLNKEAFIETAQAVQVFEVQQQNDYNDPYLPLQHGFRTLQVAQSHRWAKGRGVTVAVIDTGIDLTHTDLSHNFHRQKNFVDKSERQFRSDIHGTAVAGIIAAAADNDTGMVGVAPNVTLFAMKACWQTTGGSSAATCNSYTLAKALNVAINSEVDVINLSLAGPRDPLLERLLKVALNANIIVVGAIGPAGSEMFPTVVPGTLAVATEDSDIAIAVKAPGRKVLATRPANNYEFYDGSSFSAAHVSGLAALVRELRENLSPAELSALLNRTASSQTGVVNACRALAELAGENLQACLASGS
jgi:hypothetical protein